MSAARTEPLKALWFSPLIRFWKWTRVQKQTRGAQTLRAHGPTSTEKGFQLFPLEPQCATEYTYALYCACGGGES